MMEEDLYEKASISLYSLFKTIYILKKSIRMSE